MKLDALKRIYFIGIGGIGMSALARYFNRLGAEIYGYDKTETKLTKKLVSEGMKIHYEDDVKLIPQGIDVVVYTPAVPKSHTALAYLMNSDIPVLKRSEMLGVISRAKKCIAIAGTHGKTTTSSMTAHLLKDSGIDISCFLGGIANNFESNYCFGESDWTVIEADEFDRSFHRLSPEIAVLLSMDPDHLDIYGKKEKMQESFEIFLSKVNNGGKVIMEESLLPAFRKDFLDKLKSRGIQIETFGQDSADYAVSNLMYRNGRQWFACNDMKNLKLMMPGFHNVTNMCASIAVARSLGVQDTAIAASVYSFSGIKRRFEVTVSDELIFVDDYAHHPSELDAAIGAARQLWPDARLTVIFQPHLFSRTRDFMEDFGRALSRVDELLLMEIYPARELPIEGINSAALLEKITIAEKRLVQREDLMSQVKNLNTEVLMTLGAGDIDVFPEQIIDWFNKND